MIEFRELSQYPDAERVEAIIINREPCGKLITCKKSACTKKYHVVLNIDSCQPRDIIQGWGDKPEEAISDALVSGRRNACMVLGEIEVLEKKIKEKS
jgi:hypothetical protein